MTCTNTRIVLARRPQGTATTDCFRIEQALVTPPVENEVQVAVEYLSVDAGTRTMLEGEGFHAQVGLGEPILAGGVGRVVESRAQGWEPGQAVLGGLGAQSRVNLPVAQLTRIDNEVLPIQAHLGVLSMTTGGTAWIGMRCVAKPKPNDWFVVSAAAGAVGSIAAQIAKKDGARVIGIAGGVRKTKFLLEQLGLDAAIDYKSESVGERLKELAPGGVNGFFDNVGGSVLDAVLDNLALRARVTICGGISQYNNMNHIVGPSAYLRLAERQAVMEGFAFLHFPEQFSAATAELTQWVLDDSLVLAEEVLEGIERYPQALEFMFSGGNLGKLLVKVG